MNLDIKTLFLTLTLVMIVAAFLLWILAHLHRTIAGPRDWLIWKVLLAASVLAILSLEGQPPIIAGTTTASLQYLAMIFLVIGNHRFCGRPFSPWVMGGIWLACCVSFVSTVIGPSPLLWRLLVHTVLIGSLHIFNGWLLFRWSQKGNISQRICASIFAIHGLIIYGHAAFLTLSPPVAPTVLQAGPIIGVLLVEIIVQNIISTGCLVLMVAERLRDQLKDRITDLDETRRSAEEANQELRNFLAMVSHEFRTPLSIIDASATVVGCNIAVDDQESSEELQRIKRVTIRLSNLVEACLTDDWLDSGSIIGPTEDLSLRPIVDGLASVQGVRLCWRSEGDVVLSASPHLLSIAISSLIDNANKYGNTRDGTWIECFCYREVGEVTDWVRIDVHDDGPGVPSAVLPRITEKYYRAPTNLNKPGAGLGLYLVRRIMTLHGGYLKVSRDQDTVFSLRLPIRDRTFAEGT